MIKKLVGGVIEVSDGNTELVTWENLGYDSEVESLSLNGFYIKNEDIKDIYVKINGGSEMLLMPGEAFNFDETVTDIESCIVITPSSKARWGGLF